MRKLQSAITPVLSLFGAKSTDSGQLIQAIIRNRILSPSDFPKAIYNLSIEWERLREEDKVALKRTFLDRAYWSRLWIIQEIMLARQILLSCGHDELPWAYLERLCLTFKFLHGGFQRSVYLDVRKCFSFENGLVLIRGLSKANLPYIELIQELLCNCSCGNPKDYVYGILGVLNLTKSTIYPNYKKSVPGIYLDATRSIIREYGNLDYLCLPKCRALKEDHNLEALDHIMPTPMMAPEYLSSWTLDWAANHSISFLDDIISKAPSLDVDSALSTDQSSLLLLKGVPFSNITFISDIFARHSKTPIVYEQAKRIVRTIPGYNNIDEICSIIQTLMRNKYTPPYSAGFQQLGRDECLILLFFLWEMDWAQSRRSDPLCMERQDKIFERETSCFF